MDSTGGVRQQGDLAEMVEMLLDKGVVVNADIAVSVGDTELLGIEIRAAIASFETAARYGLEFPEGTDRERIEAATERSGAPVRDEEGTRSLGVRPGGAEIDRDEDDRESADEANLDAPAEATEEGSAEGREKPDPGDEPAERAAEPPDGGGQTSDDG